MNRVLYYISLISEILFLIMTLILFPIIIQSGFSGFLFLITVLILIGLRLFMIVSKNNIARYVKTYNIFMIVLTFYLGIIFTRIMLVKFYSSAIYELSMTYCKNNFFLIALTMICVILNTIILLLTEKRCENVSLQ